MKSNKLYTWIDIQDAIQEYFENNNENLLENLNFRAYWDGLTISYCKPQSIENINNILDTIFLSRFNNEDNNFFIILENNQKFSIFYEEVEIDEIEKLQPKPSINRMPFVALRNNEKLNLKPIEKPVFFAFHSFKGGVGRTLHAMSLAIHLSEKSKVLLIDADFEAPGISWLVESQISFSDFLAMIHGNNQHSEIIKNTAEIIKTDSKENNNLYILPAFRNIKDKTPILEIKPEHIFQFSDNPFILTEILEQLANELKVDYVILDLRAGVSELSSSWFFDTRINKVYVTTLSSQSILGTSIMFKIINKFETQNFLKTDESKLPFLIISQIPVNALNDIELSWSENYSEEVTLFPLRKAITDAFINLNEYRDEIGYENLSDNQIIGRILLPLTLFSIEYDSLKSLPSTWEDVSKVIKQNELHSKMSKLLTLVKQPELNNFDNENFAKSRKKLEKVTNDLIYAEKSIPENFLITQSINNLANKFSLQTPIAVIVGAKGSGKTFLYQQIIKQKNWDEFGKKVIGKSFSNKAIVFPVSIPSNRTNNQDFIEISNDLLQITNSTITRNIWQEIIKPDLENTIKKELSVSQWREKWLDYIAWAGSFEVEKNGAGRRFVEILKTNKTKVVAVFDGLEDLFKNFNNDKNEQKSLESLLQDVPNWLESQVEKYLGIIICVRKDLVTSAITQNTGQFLSKYSEYELKWNSEEALRLIHWILNNYKIFENPTLINLNEKEETELVTSLYNLWGIRMGKNNSKEAFSNNWVLGSLANLKKLIQSRDIVRFLYEAAKLSSSDSKMASTYTDRLLFPSAIQNSIAQVGKDKIIEVKIENKPLKEILEILEIRKNDLKFPCSAKEIKEILGENSENNIRILVDNGVVLEHNGEYYMAEIFRKGMGFEPSRRGRPKVLYF